MKTVRILGFVVIAIIVFFVSTDGLRKFGETDDSIPRTFEELGEYIEYSQVVNEINLPAGYTIDAFGLKYPWILFMLLVLFVEIFAKAEKIKEENAYHIRHNEYPKNQVDFSTD